MMFELFLINIKHQFSARQHKIPLKVTNYTVEI